VYNVTKNHPGLHQGLFYYYRVTAQNRLGLSNTSDLLFKQFGRIPFSMSFIGYPTAFPIPGDLDMWRNQRLLRFSVRDQSRQDVRLFNMSPVYELIYIYFCFYHL
jgi:hypothetical protein